LHFFTASQTSAAAPRAIGTRAKSAKRDVLVGSAAGAVVPKLVGALVVVTGVLAAAHDAFARNARTSPFIRAFKQRKRKTATTDHLHKDEQIQVQACKSIKSGNLHKKLLFQSSKKRIGRNANKASLQKSFVEEKVRVNQSAARRSLAQHFSSNVNKG
jgi:nucleoside phosphorylase